MMINARRLFKDISDLPTIPAIVSRVLSRLDSPEVEPDEIGDLILSDQVLAARVIRVVNSPLYRPASQIISVKRALLYLGFKSIKELILTSYFIDSIKNKDQSFDMNLFWMHSFSVGAMSRHIAAIVGYGDMERAYLVGIIHDIGKVFLGHYRKEDYGRMLNGISNTSFTTYEAEYEVFSTTHCEIGLCLAQRWNFPPAYCEVILYHHTSELATEDPLLTAIVSLADFFCLSHVSASGVAQASIPGHSEENAWNVLKQYSKESVGDSLEHFLSELADEYEKISRETDQLFNTMVAEAG
jgi:putative nucleotidyltransferase with HDIG domain